MTVRAVGGVILFEIVNIVKGFLDSDSDGIEGVFLPDSDKTARGSLTVIKQRLGVLSSYKIQLYCNSWFLQCVDGIG